MISFIHSTPFAKEGTITFFLRPQNAPKRRFVLLEWREAGHLILQFQVRALHVSKSEISDMNQQIETKKLIPQIWKAYFISYTGFSL